MYAPQLKFELEGGDGFVATRWLVIVYNYVSAST